MVSAGSVIGSGWLLGTLNASEVAGPDAILSWIIGAASLGYLNAKWWHGLVNSAGLLTGKGLVVAVVAMFAFTAVNLLGVKWMADGNSIMMIWKILVPVATVILILSKSFHSSNFHAGGGFMPFGIKGVFVALPLGVIFALEGFEQAAQLAGEARNPKRDVPLAVVGSMLMGAALYWPWRSPSSGLSTRPTWRTTGSTRSATPARSAPTTRWPRRSALAGWARS